MDQIQEGYELNERTNEWTLKHERPNGPEQKIIGVNVK